MLLEHLKEKLEGDKSEKATLQAEKVSSLLNGRNKKTASP